MRTFGPQERDEFRTLVRSMPALAERAADLADGLARHWLGVLPAPLAVDDLRRCLHHKLIGYNAELFAHAGRALRALAAARRWVGDAALGPGVERELRVVLPDVWLGEYYLFELLRSLGWSLRDEQGHELTRARLESGLILPPACHERAGFVPLEVALPACASSATMPKADVLFVGTMPNYLNPMTPVIEHLAGRGVACACVVPKVAIPASDQPGWGVLSRIPRGAPPGVRIMAIEDLVDAGVLDRQARARALMQGWLDAEGDVPRGSIEEVEGVSIWAILRRELARAARESVPASEAYLEIAERAIARSGARTLVVARLRRSVENAFACVARRRGVRIAMLIHGHVSARPEWRADTGWFEPADVVCAWGQPQQATILRAFPGLGPERVVVTGNPQWDLVAARGALGPPERERTRRDCAEELGLDPARPWLVWASQELSRGAFGAALSACVRARAQLIVKVHPSEDPAWYRGLVDTARAGHDDAPRVPVVAGAQPSLHDLLLSADALLTFHSTTNLEALLLGTPVITVALGELAAFDRVVPLEEFGQTTVFDDDSLARALASIPSAGTNPACAQELRRVAREAGTRIVAHAPGLPSATRRVADLLI